ncbi:MAG: DUF2726 domain-containing protein [Lentisphaeria bacterium]|nr:DUF2726 domain-containing protein [Lentisphaeria bacterium]
MTLLIALIVFILIAGVILTILKATGAASNSAEEIPVKRKRLLSEAELNFYHVLKSIIQDDQEISCKCRLEDIMYVENCPKKEAYRSKIKSRHVDFIIYNPQNGYTDYAIELDDKSHETERQVKSDQLKDQIFQKIGLPLIRIKAKRSYQPEEIRKIIEDNIMK